MNNGLPFGEPAGTEIPVPLSARHGVLIPAAASAPTGLPAWDPWTWANLAKQQDQSMPEVDAYGEAVQGDAGSIVAEWGGMPAPARDWQDQTDAVLLVPHPIPNSSGPAGTFDGPAQTAWEYTNEPPAPDYASTVFLGGGGG